MTHEQYVRTKTTFKKIIVFKDNYIFKGTVAKVIKAGINI